MPGLSSVVLLISLSVVYSLATPPGRDCKCTPASSCWPSESSWATLNTTVAGQLIRSVPPASVCYPSQPNHNETACEIIRSQWTNSRFHAANPISIDYPLWANNSCPPIFPNGTSVNGDVNAGKKGCQIGGYPVYVVDARTNEQVAEALKWAGEKSVRVVVKATGHSHEGRSTGYGSLSIWTHNLRGINYIENFKPTHCPINVLQPAARIAAGEIGSDILMEMAKHNSVIVTGADPTVGIVGWLTGGGHGFLSSTYGMGSDNLLEAIIVTPAGEILTANPCRNTDLFFAIRGGGGGTYGVVTSVVVKAYPTPKSTLHTLTVASIAPNSTSEFWEMVADVHAEMPKLKNGGMQGYYYILGPPIVPSLTMAWIFMSFDKANATVEALVKPITTRLDKKNGTFYYASNTTSAPDFLSLLTQLASPNGEPVGGASLALGSRLLTAESVSDTKAFARTLAQIGPSGDPLKPNGPFSNLILIGHMIASTQTPSYYPQTSSLHPAWRKTLAHFIVAAGWPDGTPQAGIQAARDDMTFNKTAALRKLEPNTGAYFNECDAFEPDWKTAFFGANYPRLLDIKRRYDPNRVLWCRGCVGSDEWTENEEGRLCRIGRESREELKVREGS